MSDNDSWNKGITGQAPGANADWNSYTAGKAVRDLNQAELNRQNAAWAQPNSPIGSDSVWIPPGGGGGGASLHVSSDPRSPLCARRKSHLLGVGLSVLAGPLGLFYVSRTGALVLLGAVVLGAALSGSASIAAIWPFGSLAAIVWSIVAVNAYNRRADATDAAGLAAWQKAQDATPATS